MSSIVFDSNGRGRTVKNLDWFFRKARTTIITSFKMFQHQSGHQFQDWTMAVTFEDGCRYESDYADLSVFKDVMNRQRSLKGVVVEVDPADGAPYEITLGRK